MKKITSIVIVVAIFAWIVAIGFFITKQAFTSGVSNAQLIANIINAGPATTSTINFVHLNYAMADNVAEPKPTVTFTGIYLNEIATTSPAVSQQTLQVILATLIHLKMGTGSSEQ